MRTLTHAEFLKEFEAQGVPQEHYAVICPACKTVQSVCDFGNANVADWNGFFGFSCIGRFTGQGDPSKANSKGCNWTLGGLLQIHSLEVTMMDSGMEKKCRFFEIATPEQAQEHMKANLKRTKRVEEAV